MTGRKNPEPTEQEKEREYMLEQKRGYGDSVVGDRAEFLEDKGAVGDVRQQRETYDEFKDEIPRGKEARKR